MKQQRKNLLLGAMLTLMGMAEANELVNFNHDEWTFVVGEGFDDETPIYDRRLVKEMVEAQDVQIVRRVCPSCVVSHKDIYYRRLTPMPADFDLVDTLMNNWFSENNLLNVDFSLHSNYQDAISGSNGWTFCNYDDPNIGFPRDCGPNGRVNHQWNAYNRGGGDANHHAFLIPADPDFESTYVPPLFANVKGTDYAFQQGTRNSGTSVTHFDNNDYLVYPSINFGSAGTTKGMLLNHAKANDGGKLEVRLGGVNGQLVAELNPAKTGSWSTYITAYLELLTDVSGVHDVTLVAKNSGGVMNVGWFELTDFSERSSATNARIPATEYSAQSGVRFESSSGNVGHFDNNDYVTYSNVNFGSAGSTDGIIFHYAKANNEGKMEVRSGGPTGTLLATFNPVSTRNWQMYRNTYLALDNMSGLQDITFVGKNVNGVLNFKWFEPSKWSSELYPRILATELSDQSGLRSTYDKITHFDNNDYATYSRINFGSSAATKSIRVSYAKGNSKGKVEIRLDGPEGEIIATYSPQNTGGWDEFVTVEIPINLVEGVHDLTFVGKEQNGVWDPEWFELSSTLLFNLDTDYKVDDENGKDVQCTYDSVLDAYTEQVYNRYFINSGASAERKFISHLGVSNRNGAKNYVKNNLCGAAQAAIDKIPLDDITYEEGSDFIELFYSGRGSWNEETETKLFPGTDAEPANVLKTDAYKVNTYKDISEKSVFEMPNLPQFDPSVCTSHAAQCCWPRDRQANDNNGNCNTPYDSNCVDKDVADNTDLCYNTLDKAPYANGIDASGFSTYDHEGPVHCHGFAWSTDDEEITSRYKANALFFVSMYDHMYQRGYVENIPGSPMCGCVEHMPVVSRSDCTQTNVKEYYTFHENSSGTGFSSTINGIKLQYQACQGADNTNNDLSAFVQQLVNDGKLSTTEQAVFEQRVVGKNNCDDAVDKLWEDSGFKKGHEINSDEWTFVVGEGFDDETRIYDKRLVKEMVEAQDVQIVRRVCPSCVVSHKDIYYRRLTPMPADFDLVDTLMNNWFSENNLLNVDFSLHSNYVDAYYGTNGWTFCNYDDPNIGFPRDCGPHGRVNHQWNAYNRGGGDANHHAFLIPADPDFVSTYVPPLFANVKGTDYAFQQGTKTSGTSVTHFDNNDYLVYPSINFGSAGTTKGMLLNHAKANDGGKLEVRLGGVNGQLVAELNPAKTGSWSTYITAYLELLTDVSGVHDVTLVAKNTNGVMNVGWFELTDFSERSSATNARIPATEYSAQSGVRFETHGNLGYFDNNDYVTYTNVNFGSAGTTNNIKLRYAKSNNGGMMEIRSGGPTGTLLATFNPTNTRGWQTYTTVNIPVSASGIQDITFVGKNTNGVLNFKWFELTA